MVQSRLTKPRCLFMKTRCLYTVCSCRLSHIPHIAYRDAIYELLVTPYELLVTYINHLRNFTVKLGRDKETVLAIGNYTLGSASQSELQPRHTQMFGCGQVNTKPPPPRLTHARFSTHQRASLHQHQTTTSVEQQQQQQHFLCWRNRFL